MVNVYRLITRGTLEEKIMGLQKFKMNIANTVISQENASLQSMGTDQLLDLFTLDKVKNLTVCENIKGRSKQHLFLCSDRNCQHTKSCSSVVMVSSLSSRLLFLSCCKKVGPF